MEITESKIYEAFGLDAGAKDQDAADPEQADEATDSENTGANDQDVADPEQEEEPAEENAEAAGESGDTSGQSEEERRANARRRREQERQQEISAAVAQALQQERTRNNAAMENFFRDAGLKNTITGEPITNMREFTEWKTAYDSAKLQQDLKSGKITQEDLDKMVKDNPVVRQANTIIQQQRAEKLQANVDSQIREIHELDPSINSVQDLLKMDNYQDFYKLVKESNMNFLQAYKLVNYDRLTSSKAQAAKQQALNNQRGKDHLTGTASSRGAGAKTVPADEMAMFRLFNPNATEADIIKYYNKQKG